ASRTCSWTSSTSSSPRACERPDVAARSHPRPGARPFARGAAATGPQALPDPRLARAAALEPEVAARVRDGRLRDDHRADRAVDLGRTPARLQPARDPPGALLEPPLRHDRPGERRL